MSGPNPYESPKSGQPLKSVQVVKRGIGVVTILLLTPVAVGIAFAASCGDTTVFVSVVPQRPDLLLAVIMAAYAIFFVPPLIALIVMIVWAVRAYSRSSRTVENSAGRDD